MRARLLVLLLVASVAYAAEDADTDSVTVSRPLMVKLLESNQRLRQQVEKAYEDAAKAERERETCMESRST